MSLTKKQKQILDYIEEFVKEFGYAPSYREIGEHFGLTSPATIFQHIKSLEDKGYIKVKTGEARSIEIIEDGTISYNERTIELPLAGLITAGEPIEAIEESETISIPSEMKPIGECFALLVKGESMIEEGIHDGDYVIVEKKNTAKNGDTVVALIDDQFATLKKFYKEKGYIRLQPANKTMKPIKVKGDLKVQGKVVGLIRKYK